jgi:hypothetical protein
MRAMGEAKSGRKFWQFHLSTAILTVLTLGTLLTLNFRLYSGSTEAKWLYGRDTGDFTEIDVEDQCGLRGWPLAMARQDFDYPITWDGPPDVLRNLLKNKPRVMRWYGYAVAINAAVALAVMLIMVLPSEWLIRRREAHSR